MKPWYGARNRRARTEGTGYEERGSRAFLNRSPAARGTTSSEVPELILEVCLFLCISSQVTTFGEQLQANEIITVISELRLKTGAMRVATFADVQCNKLVKSRIATGSGG